MGDCEGRATMHTNLWIHFVHHYVRDTVVILDEGNRPHPIFLSCDMLVPSAALNRRHPSTYLCTQGSERNRQRLMEEEDWTGAVTSFWDYVRLMETVS